MRMNRDLICQFIFAFWSEIRRITRKDYLSLAVRICARSPVDRTLASGAESVGSTPAERTIKATIEFEKDTLASS